MQGLGMEVRGFVAAILSGMTGACAYACIRRLRKVFRHSRMLVEIEDAVYWICMALYLFDQIYYVNNGVIRWYFVVGIIVGAIVFGTVERRIRNINSYVKKEKEFHENY